MAKHNPMIDDLLREAFPEKDWAKFDEMNKALNFDLWFGTAGEYFGEAEELEHYNWQGCDKAQKDITEFLADLPSTMWFDLDGQCCITEQDPDDCPEYWVWPCATCDEWVSEDESDCHDDCSPDLNKSPLWVGGDWEQFNPWEVLLFEEVWRQIR